MWRLGIKNLNAHKGRLLLTAIAVVLGVAFMSGTRILGDTMDEAFDDLFADVYENTDAVVRRTSDIEVQGQTIRGRVDASLLDTIAAVEGVDEIEGFTSAPAYLVDAEGDVVNEGTMGPPAIGASWGTVDALSPWVLDDGRAPEADDEIVIDRRSADRGDVSVGDVVTVLTKEEAREFTVVGIVRFGTADSPAGSSWILFTMEAAQQYVGEPGKFDEISMTAVEGVTQEELVERVRAVLPPGVEAITGVQASEESSQELKDALSFFDVFLLVFVVIALFVGSFVIYNTFQILVAQRQREVALLRAIGASRRQVLGAVLFEALLVGVIASLIGLVVGYGLALGLKELLEAFGVDLPTPGATVRTASLVSAFVVGVVITVAASLFPARRASKVPPIAAMRDVSVDTSGTSRRRLIIGVLVTALGVLLLVVGLTGGEIAQVGIGALLIFSGVAILGPLIARPMSKFIGAPMPRVKGITGALARENAARNPKRTAATASAIMIGLGLVAFITIFADSAQASIEDVVDENYRGDFVIDSGTFGFGGLSPTLAQRLNELPEVEVATGVRATIAQVDGGNTQLLSVDPVTVGPLFNVGVIEGTLEEMRASSLAVDDDKMEDKGWSLGDHVTVTFPETGPQDFVIDVVYTEDRLAGPYVISHEAFENNVADVFDFAVYVNIASGVDPDVARAAIEEVTADNPLADVQDRTEYKEEIAGQINQFLGIVYVMLALAIIIAFFGIANTITLSIIERRREMGVLRAVGMSRRQLRSSVRWEAVIIGLIGTLLGLVIGLFFSWALTQSLEEEGFTVYRVPIASLVIITIAAAFGAVLFALRPAWKASKLDVLEAIATE